MENDGIFVRKMKLCDSFPYLIRSQSRASLLTLTIVAVFVG